MTLVKLQSPPAVVTPLAPLAGKRRAMLIFVADYARAHGYPPTMREIGEGCAIRSTSDVSLKLSQLEEAGYLQPRSRRSAREIGITDAGRRAIDDGEQLAVRCPSCGEKFEVVQ